MTTDCSGSITLSYINRVTAGRLLTFLFNKDHVFLPMHHTTAQQGNGLLRLHKNQIK